MCSFATSVALSPEKSGFGPLLFAGNIEEGIKNAAKLGFSAVELSLRDSDSLDREKVTHLLKENNLKVSTIATGQSYYKDGFSLCAKGAEKRRKVIQRLKGHIRFASQLGTQVIIGGVRGTFESIPWRHPVPHRLYQATLDSIEESLEYACKYGVILTLEPINRYETNFINTTEEALELLEKLKVENFKILLDTFHMNIDEPNLGEAILKAGKHLSFIHFADSNRFAPGMGHIDFKEVYRSLKKINYQGYICAEVLPVPNDLLAMKQSIHSLRRLINTR
ncbi:MAG: TIM barrel protein [Candidatus Hydrothermarchaeota archaeon]